MKLVKPSLRYAASFSEAMAEYREASNHSHMVNEDRFLKEIGNPKTAQEYIALTNKHEKGISLPSGWIPYSVFWLVDKGEFIGRSLYGMNSQTICGKSAAMSAIMYGRQKEGRAMEI